MASPYSLAAFAALLLIAIPTGFSIFNNNISSQTVPDESNTQLKENGTEELYDITGSTHFLVSVQTGNKSIYERKAIIGPLPIIGLLEWGDEKIPINGFVNKTSGKGTYQNQIVQIEAFQNDELIYQKFVKAGGNGYYLTYFYPPADGTVVIKATLMSQIPKVWATTSVIATQSWMPAILIILFVSASVAAAVVSIIINNKGNKYPNALKWGLIPVVILNIFTYIILYKFPPFDTTSNTVIATALIAPMAAYIYETLKK